MTIYINNGATSYPKPERVVQRVCEVMGAIPYDPGRGLSSGPDVLTECRQKVASLIHARDHKRVILTPGATFSLNYAIHGTGRMVDRPAHFISTVLEHNSVLRPLHTLTKEGVEVTYLSYEDALDPRCYAAAATESTRAIVVTLCSNVNGATPDIPGISQVCDEKGLTLIIDAAQGIGSIELDVSQLTPRLFVAMAGHKGLFGPPGTGALYIGEGIDTDQFPPMLQGGTGVKSELNEQPRELPTRYEVGTMNIPGFAGLSVGVDFVLEKGVGNIAQHKQDVAEYLVNSVKDIPGIDLCLPPDGDYRAGVFCLNLEGWDPEDAAYVLSNTYDIITRTGLHCAPLMHEALGYPRGAVRISVGYFNTVEEMAVVADALRQMAASALM